MKRGLISVAIIGTLGAFSYSLYNGGQQAEVEHMILLGLPKHQLAEVVEKSGGEITETFKYINAVSVEVTPRQLDKIKADYPSIKTFENSTVKTASTLLDDPYSNEVLKPGDVAFDESSRRVKIRGVNTSGETLNVNGLNLDIPSRNGKLRNIKLNGVWSKASNVKKGSLALSQEQRFSLADGETFDVELEFQKNIDTKVSNYAMSIGDSKAATESRMKFSVEEQSATWTIANDMSGTAKLNKLTLTAPQGNGSVTDVTINGTDVRFKEQNNGRIKLLGNFNLDAERPLVIELGFDQLTSANTADYGISFKVNSNPDIEVRKGTTKFVQGKERDTYFASIVNADDVHELGYTGSGVTVAVIDTGVVQMDELYNDAYGFSKNVHVVDLWDDSNSSYGFDDNGHGTHVTSVIANSSVKQNLDTTSTTTYNGIAPNADIVAIKAFDQNGRSTYEKVLQSLEYVIENRSLHNIRVLNLSFSALPTSYYWDDPINQLVMRAWQEGIVVVAAAGNRGSDAMSIGVPGNVPYIITVGATSDNNSPYNFNDDYVTSFSSAGPTYEGFVKPELVAPGSRIQGLVGENTFIRDHFSMFDVDPFDEHDYFDLSGTSQSTAIISGVVALMLEADPYLTPDDIKCRLIATASAAVTAEGDLAFSIYQQGAGLVNALEAVRSTERDCANEGMSIAADIAGEEHYIGPVRFDEQTEEFYIPGADGLEWNGFYNDSQLWRHTRFNADSQLWGRTSFNADSQLWRHTRFNSNSQLWRHTTFNTDSQLWGNPGFNADSQLWGNNRFNTDSQLWRHSRFNTDSQLWGNRRFSSDSITNKWVDHD